MIPKNSCMQIYYVNNAMFMSDSFSELNNFELYAGMDVINMIHDNKMSVNNTTNKPYNTCLQKGPMERNFINKDNMKYITFEEVVDGGYYKNESVKNKYSISNKPNYRCEDNILCNLIDETYIRNVSTTAVYMYISIPYKFINDNLISTIGKTDLRKARIWFDSIEEGNGIRDMIEKINIGDDLFPDTIPYNGTVKKKPKEFYKWRADMDLGLVYSINKYGYYNPVINVTEDVIFFDGTHRIAYGAMTGKSVPFIQKMPVKNGKVSDVILLSPPFFRDNSCAVFLFSKDTESVKVWFLSGDELYKKGIIKHDEDFNTFDCNISHELKTMIAYRPYDCKIEENPFIKSRLKRII